LLSLKVFHHRVLFVLDQNKNMIGLMGLVIFDWLKNIQF
jgi:hypothetical protein